MARRLNAKEKSFAADFDALLFAKREIEAMAMCMPFEPARAAHETRMR